MEPKVKICIKCGKKPSITKGFCHTCKHKQLNKTCMDCGAEIVDTAMYCSIHSQIHRPPGNGYKVHEAKLRNGTYPPIGREIVTSMGYVAVKVIHGNNRNHLPGGYGNYVMKHRLVMEQAIGRKLANDEVVHHLDGNKQNNSISNLVLLTNKQHNKINHFLALLGELSPEHRQKVIQTINLRFPSEIN